ncbi:MAG: hypothetical protein JWQ43_345 [Glaciihabitans sp.]|nr:hypothetical protein [Glaciihabitans sp.]
MDNHNINNHSTEDYGDGSWMFVTFEVPDDITVATPRVLAALPNPFYDVMPGEITILPDMDKDDHVSISLDETGNIAIDGVEDFPGWDRNTKNAVVSILHRLWFILDDRPAPIEAGETLFAEAVLARNPEVRIPVEGSLTQLTLPIRLSVEVEGTALADIDEAELDGVAELSAYDVTAELVLILAGLRERDYE